MTRSRPYKMRLLMTSPSGEFREADFDEFSIGAGDAYPLTVGEYSTDDR